MLSRVICCVICVICCVICLLKKESYYVDLGKVENEYHISEYDYKNGKIITDRTTYYFKEGTGLSSTTKSNTFNTKDEFEVKINDEISDRNHTYKKIK